MALLALITGSPAAAQFGPPEPRAGPMSISLGAGLHNVNSNWLPYHVYINRTRLFSEGSFALNERLEFFGRVGGSDFVLNDVATYRPDRFADVSTDGEGYPLFASGGVRGILFEFDQWLVGGSLEIAQYAGLKQNIRWDYNVYQTLLVDPPTEINVGFSIAYQFERSVVYAGPLLHFGYTKVDVRTHRFGPNWEVEDRVDALTIRDKGGVGGFVGWRFALGDEGWFVELEGTALSGGGGGAISLFKAF